MQLVRGDVVPMYVCHMLRTPARRGCVDVCTRQLRTAGSNLGNKLGFCSAVEEFGMPMVPAHTVHSATFLPFMTRPLADCSA